MTAKKLYHYHPTIAKRSWIKERDKASSQKYFRTSDLVIPCHLCKNPVRLSQVFGYCDVDVEDKDKIIREHVCKC